jgi:pimeloyl-ACP methyl ester carboxylesterase
MLARSGVDVLRFDYSGTGDSAGDLSQASVTRWCSDIRQASAELSELAEVRGVSLVGFRLGAALAALASTAFPVRDLVLWEPAVDGRTHLRELRRIQRWKRGVTSNPPRLGRREILGHRLPPGLVSGIEEIRLDDVSRCRAERIHLFASRERAEYRRLAARLRDRPASAFQLEIVPEDARDNLDGALLSSRIQRAIASAITDPGS